MHAWRQETEQGRLFASRSQWHDFRSALKQSLSILGRLLSLWKTSIQTVEAKHGVLTCKMFSGILDPEIEVKVPQKMASDVESRDLGLYVQAQMCH